MKKIVPLFVCLAFASSLLAQDAIKNFRFGGTLIPSLAWYKPDNLKKFAKDGSVFKFGVIINGEYSFSENFAFGFGLGLTGSGGKISFTDTASYYFSSVSDNGILALSDTSGLNGKYKFYKLNSRTYKASYYLLPLSLKMRTNMIGGMRYFFQPALTIGIKKKVRADDMVDEIPQPPAYTCTTCQKNQTQTDLDITKDMASIKLSATLSAGGEYYLSGSTAFTFAIGYDYGLTNVVSSDSEYLLKTPYASGSTNRRDMKATSQKNICSGLVFSLGFLF